MLETLFKPVVLKHFIPERLYRESDTLFALYAKYPPDVFKYPSLNESMRQYDIQTRSVPRQVIDLYRNLPVIGGLADLSPTGFIFHPSRCGSTLLSQMIATSQRHLVITEPDGLSYYLLSCLRGEVTFDATIFRTLLCSFGQRFIGYEECLFIKFASWNTLFMKEILSAFPEVPWVYIYRDPLEILVSNLRKTTAPLRWFHQEQPIAAKVADITLSEVKSMGREEYLARCLDRYNTIAYKHLSAPGLGRLLSYDDFPGSVYPSIANHFSLGMTEKEKQAFEARGKLDAKHPKKGFFKSDSYKKNTEATPEIKQAVASFISPVSFKLRTEFES